MFNALRTEIEIKTFKFSITIRIERTNFHFFWKALQPYFYFKWVNPYVFGILTHKKYSNIIFFSIDWTWESPHKSLNSIWNDLILDKVKSWNGWDEPHSRNKNYKLKNFLANKIAKSYSKENLKLLYVDGPTDDARWK